MSLLQLAAVTHRAAEDLTALSRPPCVLALLALAAAVAATSAVARIWDRRRIQETIRQAGGTVVSITYVGLFDEWRGRTYEVTWRSKTELHCATCRTALAGGVSWGSAPCGIEPASPPSSH